MRILKFKNTDRDGRTRGYSMNWKVVHLIISPNKRLASEQSLYSWLPVRGIVIVRITIIVSQDQRISHNIAHLTAGVREGWGQHLTLAETIFVTLPVKIPHVSHVQSIGIKWTRLICFHETKMQSMNQWCQYTRFRIHLV